MQVEYVPIGSIKPYERNAKKHPDEQVEHIANSIREFGWQQPIVVDKDGVVVIGHGRLLAAKKLGYDKVPIVRAESLNEEQIKALRIADNKTNESDWDLGFLEEEIESILDIDMSDFGFDVFKDELPTISKKELKPFEKSHCLITCGVNMVDEVMKVISVFIGDDSVDVEWSLN